MTSFSQTISADAALRRILAGNNRFTRGVAGQRNYLKELLNLADGQKPFATILGCSDSRVPPTLIFDAGLGELFVIRVAGNVFSPEIASSLQYAASHLETPLFMVLGHDNCGAIDATLKTIRSKEVDRSRIELVAEKLMPALSSIDMTQDEPQ